MQYPCLCLLHPPSLAGLVVVVAGQVQSAMHHQMRQVTRRARPAAQASRRTTPNARMISGAGAS